LRNFSPQPRPTSLQEWCMISWRNWIKIMVG
jgi:hypothetical protein